MKKWFALLLVLVLCLPCMMVCAEESKPKEYTSGDWRYILLEDGTADITNYANKEATSVEITEKIDGHPVTISSTNPFWCCNLLPSFTVSPSHPTLATIDGVLFNKVEKKLVAFPRAFKVTEYAVPEGILAIGDYAFKGCKSLTSIKLPESVTSIGDYAFWSCDSLTGIMLESVTSIGSGAFAFSESLTEICVSPDNPAFAVIDGVLFDKAGESLVVFPVGDVRTEYTVPDGVVCVGDYAFCDCASLTDITIPKSVTSISDGAFIFSLPTVHVAPDSYAEAYCKDNDLPIAYIENTDWLNG